MSQRADERTDGRMNERTDGRMNGEMDGGSDGRTDGNKFNLYWVSQKKLLYKSEGKTAPKKEDDLADS